MLKKETHIRLKAARKAAGFKSANDFADAINVPRTTYSQHERGDRNIKDTSLENYALHLGVNETWLRTGAGSAFKDLEKQVNVDNSVLEEELRSHQLLSQLSNPSTQSLDNELLKTITNALFQHIQEQNLNVSPEAFAEALTEAYSSIVASTDDGYQRLHMVPAVIKPYLKLLSK